MKKKKDFIAIYDKYGKDIYRKYTFPSQRKKVNKQLAKEYNLENAAINTTIYCLGRAILKLSEADLIVFTKGWENARGCSKQQRPLSVKMLPQPFALLVILITIQLKHVCMI